MNELVNHIFKQIDFNEVRCFSFTSLLNLEQMQKTYVRGYVSKLDIIRQVTCNIFGSNKRLGTYNNKSLQIKYRQVHQNSSNKIYS